RPRRQRVEAHPRREGADPLSRAAVAGLPRTAEAAADDPRLDGRHARPLRAAPRRQHRRVGLVEAAPEDPGAAEAGTLRAGDRSGRASRGRRSRRRETVTPPPLLVLGVRRSGTTLLRVMLDRHSELAIPDESYFIPQLAGRHGSTIDVDAFVDDLRRLPTLR